MGSNPSRANSWSSAQLEQNLIIAQLNEKGKEDKGEIARVLRKLAEAFHLRGADGDAVKAEDFRVHAEAMREEIQGPRFATLGDSDLSYAMMNFHAFW